MMMYFHGGFNEVILFDFWRISTLAGLIGSMVGCFIMGVLYEGIKSYREHWMNGAFHTVNYNQVLTCIQVIPSQIDCSIFYTNLHELVCQFISCTNWVNSGKFMGNF